MKKWLLLALFSALSYTLLQPTLTGSSISIPEEIGPPIETYFCPQDDCELALNNFIEGATTSLDCALFDVSLYSTVVLLDEKKGKIPLRLVVDNLYASHVDHFAKTDTGSQLTHNKFCVADKNRVIVGSMNPTDNGAHYNNNNLNIIHSKSLAENYGKEFEELWSGTFGKGGPTPHPVIRYNNITIRNYFCPEDRCADRLVDLIKSAERTIFFMTFVFTHQTIGQALIDRSTELPIEGIIEKRSNSQYSVKPLLEAAGINVSWDQNPKTMHHKVFIIDDIVALGSFNPTGAGDNKNDENLLIIEDGKLASKYKEEYRRLR